MSSGAYWRETPDSERRRRLERRQSNYQPMLSFNTSDRDLYHELLGHGRNRRETPVLENFSSPQVEELPDISVQSSADVLSVDPTVGNPII